MGADQRAAAMATGAAMSERGAQEAAAVIALEDVLGALERRGVGRAGSVATPSATGSRCSASCAQGAWAWRVGGHHVAIQVTPRRRGSGRQHAIVPWLEPGRRAGGTDRGLPDAHREEILARDLLTNLSPEARAIAVVDPIAPPEIHSGFARADLRSVPSGIRHDDLGAGAERLRASSATISDGRRTTSRPRHGSGSWMQAWPRSRLRGLDLMSGSRPLLRLRGPEFLIEYDNTQNDANHIHVGLGTWNATGVQTPWRRTYGWHHASGS